MTFAAWMLLWRVVQANLEGKVLTLDPEHGTFTDMIGVRRLDQARYITCRWANGRWRMSTTVDGILALRQWRDEQVATVEREFHREWAARC